MSHRPCDNYPDTGGNIDLHRGLDHVARELRLTNSLIGGALRLLTDQAENQRALQTSLGTLVRVLDAVHWSAIGKGDPEAWLYFYEDFLGVYDNDLRKKTGSYYTPPQVVDAMVRLADDALRLRFGESRGLASPSVTVADPALGTGTFLLSAFRQIAEKVKADEGPGAVPAAMSAAMERVLGFEIQLGPFAVAQLRVLAELTELIGSPPTAPLRVFVADTLSNPYEELEWIPGILESIAESRRQANEIKKHVPITVVIGNPPYKEKAKGRGAWVEEGGKSESALLTDWMPPREWGVGAHAKHLRNLYIYFWRWATWKVFDQDKTRDTGIVCFITVAGFLAGPGFQRMREYLRQKCADIWVVDCSPEGHQPEVGTRVFQGVQQPVCIVLASRSPGVDENEPARVHYLALTEGDREEKFTQLGALSLAADTWRECPSEWRAEFLPRSTSAWSAYPRLEDFFVYNGSGVMPGRTWVIAPDADSLVRRWNTLVGAPDARKAELFHPHLRNGKPGDRHVDKSEVQPLSGHTPRLDAVSRDTAEAERPVRYGYRSFDRQWILPDNRLLNQANPTLWAAHSDRQLYVTAPSDRAPSGGPALTFTAAVPDLHHYAGRGGRTFPLWRDKPGTDPNVNVGLLNLLSSGYNITVTPEDIVSYIAAIAAHPAFTTRFLGDLVTPGLRIPLTRDPALFAEAAELGRSIVWLHTFGERFADPARGRPPGPPRLHGSGAPTIPAAGAIPSDPGRFPDSIEYDKASQLLHVGGGYVERVTPAMRAYEVSGKNILRQWFSYRRANRERPIIGDRRQPSPLGNIQPEGWPAEYTTELLNVLNVLGMLVALEPRQADLLNRVCGAELIDAATVAAATESAPSVSKKKGRSRARPEQHEFL